MAPETILYKGQNKGVDHWSWAVLVYRLVTAKYPFYQKGMDEIALYKRICKGAFEVNGEMSVMAVVLVGGQGTPSSVLILLTPTDIQGSVV